MKLHVSASLRRAIMACYAVATVLTPTLSTATLAAGVFAVSLATTTPAQAATSTTTLLNTDASSIGAGKEYAGKIYTLQLSSLTDAEVTVDIANGSTIFREMQLDGTDSETNIAGNSSAAENCPDEGTYFWHHYQRDITGNGNTLHLDADVTSETTTTINVSCTYDTMTLGGLIVEKSDKTWIVGRKSGKSALNLVCADGGTVRLSIGSNTTMKSGTNTDTPNINIQSNTDCEVGGGKTLTFTATGTAGKIILSQDKKLNISKLGTDTGDSSVIFTSDFQAEANSEIDIESGTSVSFSKAATLATVTNDGTLTLGTNTTINGTLTNNGTLTLSGTSTINGTLTNNGTLTLGGTVVLTSAITNNGTLNKSTGLTLDLTGVTFEQGDDNTYSFQLLTGTNKTFTLDGVTVELAGGNAGKTISYDDATGMLSYVISSHDLFFSGDTLAWEDGAVLDNGAEFNSANADFVTFTGQTTATITAPITSAGVTVAEGATLILTNAGTEANTLTADFFSVDGKLVLDGSTSPFADGTKLTGDGTGTVEFKGLPTGHENDGKAFDSLLTQFSGSMIVSGGNYKHNNASAYEHGVTSITITGTGSMYFAAAGYGGTLYLTDTAEGTVPLILDSCSVSGTIQIAGDTSIRHRWDSTINSAITGKGNLTFLCDNNNNTGLTLNGTISTEGNLLFGDDEHPLNYKLNGTLANTGDVIVNKGMLTIAGNATTKGKLQINDGTVRIGNNNNDSANKVSFSAVDVAAGSKLEFQHKGGLADGDFSELNITLHGTAEGETTTRATLAVEGSNSGNGTAVTDAHSKAITVGTVTVDGAVNINYVLKGVLQISALTGTGGVLISGDAQTDAPRATILNISNFDGTISGAPSIHTLYVDKVYLDENHDTLIKNVVSSTTIGEGDSATTVISPIHCTNFAKTGKGSLTMVGDINVSGQLTMTYEGGLYCTEAVAAKEDTEAVAAKAGLSITSVADGTILTYTGATGGLLTLTKTAVGSSKLIINLLDIADTLKTTDIDLGIDGEVLESQMNVGGITGGTLKVNESTGTWWYKKGGTASATWDSNWGNAVLASAPATLPVVSNLTGITADDDTIDSVSLYENATYHPTGSTYTAIHISGTKANAVTSVYGGADCDNSSAGVTVEADSWIKVTGGDLVRIVGGNNGTKWQNSGAHVFIGDSHIEISRGQSTPLVDYVVGGNWKDGYNQADFKGSSYISIYSDSVRGSVIGGSTSPHAKTTTFTGSSYIYIYTPQTLTDEDCTTNLENLGKYQAIVGGHVRTAHAGGSQTFGGDTNIVLDFKNFSGTATMAKEIIGGSIRSSGTVTHSGGTNITIRNAATTTFANVVIGGCVGGGSTTNINGIATLDISSGTFQDLVMGGTYDSGGGSTINVGGVNMTLSGGTYEERVMGGNFDVGDNSDNNNWTIGDINITVSGTAELQNRLFGGSVARRNKDDKTYTQGNITLDLQGGTFSGGETGGIYAAGRQSGTSKIQTASTTVKLSSTVVLGATDAPITVSGGYQFGEGMSGSTVTGDRTLVFSDAVTYTNLSNTTFIDFDVVEVAAGGSVTAPLTLSGDAGLEKTGLGELNITGTHTTTGLLEVSEGNLQLGTESAAASWVSDATVAAGATLTLPNGSISTADSTHPNNGTLILGKGHALNGQLVNNGTTIVQSGTLTSALSGGTVAIDALAGTDGTPNVVNLGGTEGSAINGGLSFDANSRLTGVSSTITTSSTNALTVTPTANTCGETATPASGHYAIINGADLVLGEQSLTLAGSLADMVKNTDADGYCYLYLTNRTLTATDLNNLLTAGHDDRFTIAGIEDGALKISVEAAGIYLATDNTSLSGYDVLDGYDGVSVSDGKTLTITLDGAPTETQGDFELANLDGGSVTIVNSATDGSVAEVELSNSTNSTVSGSITDNHTPNGGGANFTKTGEGMLSVAGEVSANSLTVEEGTLKAGSVDANSVTVESAGTLSVSGSFECDDALNMQGGTVEFTGVNPVTLEGLAGYGNITQGNIVVTGTQPSTFDGSLAGGTHIIVNGSQNFGPLFEGEDGTRGDITVSSKASAGFDLTGMSSITLDTLTLKSGSHTVFSNNAYARALQGGLDLNELIIEDGANVTIHSDGPAATGTIEICLGNVDTLTAPANSYEVALSGSTYLRYDSGTISQTGDQLWLTVQQAQNRFMPVATDGNSQAGATLLWDVDGSALTPGTELHDVWESLNNSVLAGNGAKVDEALAAVAGASTAVIGAAFVSDVERQLKAIRNRTTTMGVDQEVVNDLPFFNAWINAEGSYHTMDADGNLPGFTLSSWGGTVGVDVDCTDKLTAGLALTAMYGDLEADSADTAEGDLDTYYVSAFARYNHKRWVHTFVATVGRMDATLDRTVNYGTGSYETQGETEGLGFGLMYEVGYTIPADEEGYTCWQPVFNIAWRHTTVDAYDESGSDAGLAVGEQSYDAITIGAGARVQTVVGENLWNRYSVLEARALLKVDAGDRESTTDVALLAGSPTASVSSAERGAVGAELGVGLSIPLSADSGSIFFDASADIRSGEVEANATAGYRINF